MKKVMVILVCIGLFAPVFSFGREGVDNDEEEVKALKVISEYLEFIVIGWKDVEALLEVDWKLDIKAFKDGSNLDNARDINIFFKEKCIATYEVLDKDDNPKYFGSSETISNIHDLFDYKKVTGPVSGAEATSERIGTKKILQDKDVSSETESQTESEYQTETESQTETGNSAEEGILLNVEVPTVANNSTENMYSNGQDGSSQDGYASTTKWIEGKRADSDVVISVKIFGCKYKLKNIKKVYKNELLIDKRGLEDGDKLICTVFKKCEFEGKDVLVYVGSRSFSVIDPGLEYFSMENISIAPILSFAIGKKTGEDGTTITSTDFGLGINYMFYIKTERWRNFSNFLFGLNTSFSNTKLLNENTNEMETATVFNLGASIAYRFKTFLLQFVVGGGNVIGAEKYLLLSLGFGKLL